MVNGPAWKALIEEEFGDGIMSAIDFDMEIGRVVNPADDRAVSEGIPSGGDRVKLTMTGKFLPYRYYGATEGHATLGHKEK